MNEGQYLILCNDLKQQYDKMKKQHQKQLICLKRELAEKDELILHLKSLIQSQPHKSGPFDSIRPSASIARYSSVMGTLEFYS